jgi:hypothetical protein
MTLIRFLGVNVVITIFCNFSQLQVKKLAFFPITYGMIIFFSKTSTIFSKKHQFFWRKYFWNLNIGPRILTAPGFSSRPDWTTPTVTWTATASDSSTSEPSPATRILPKRSTASPPSSSSGEVPVVRSSSEPTYSRFHDFKKYCEQVIITLVFLEIWQLKSR